MMPTMRAASTLSRNMIRNGTSIACPAEFAFVRRRHGEGIGRSFQRFTWIVRARGTGRPWLNRGLPSRLPRQRSKLVQRSHLLLPAIFRRKRRPTTWEVWAPSRDWPGRRSSACSANRFPRFVPAETPVRACTGSVYRSCLRPPRIGGGPRVAPSAEASRALVTSRRLSTMRRTRRNVRTTKRAIFTEP